MTPTPSRPLVNAAGQRLAVLGIAAAAVAWAWANRFMQDDAYISLVYARNWVEGHGLVYNPGERVEGYTNFLWTVLLGVPLHLGWNPVAFAHTVGLACFAGTLLLTGRLARQFAGAEAPAAAAVLLLGMNYTCSAYATGGLETSLQTLLVAAALWRAFACEQRGRWTTTDLATWSTLAALAVLTRLDSAVLLLLPGLFAARAAWRARNWLAAAALVGPFSALVGPWFAWKWHYYGDWMPNTFHAKVVGFPWLRGTFYVGAFLLSYLLVVPLALHVRELWRHGRGPSETAAAAVPLRRLLLLAHLPLALWAAYVIGVGGDSLEFRLLVPAMPLAMALFAATLAAVRLRFVWLAVLAAASLIHARTFEFSPLKRGLTSIPELHRYVTGPADWRYAGLLLRDAFPGQAGVRIAVTPAGALPYHARLHTLDMLGLNERHVARHGAALSERAGHRKIATVAYLRSQGVNLVLGHPTLVPLSARPTAYAATDTWCRRMFLRAMPDPQSLPPDARMIEIPFDRDEVLLAIYLQPHPAVDAAVARLGWRPRPLVPAAATPGPPRDDKSPTAVKEDTGHA